MKKLVAWLLFFCVMTSVSGVAYAGSYADYLNLDDTKHYSEDYCATLLSNYMGSFSDTSPLWQSVSKEQNYTYIQLAQKYEDDSWVHLANELTDETLTEDAYLEYLGNFLVLLDYTCADMMSKQAEVDTLKTCGEYVVDAAEILAGTVSGNSVLATSISLLGGLLDLTVDTLEEYYYYSISVKSYENCDAFLTTIQEYSDDEMLCAAAETLKSSLLKMFNCKMEYLGGNADNLADFLAVDVFFDSFINDIVVNDPSVLDLTESEAEAVNVLGSAATLLKNASLAKDVGVLAADVVIHVSDVLHRLDEMFVLNEVREALYAHAEVYRAQIKSADDAEQIAALCSLIRSWIYVNYRGEYCVYKMLTENPAYDPLYSGPFMSLLLRSITGDQVSIEQHFKKIQSYTDNLLFSIDLLFPELDDFRRDVSDGAGDYHDLVTDAYANEYTFTAKMYNEATQQAEDTEMTYTYHIPQINLNGDEIEQLNQEIYDFFYPTIEASFYEIEEYGRVMTSEGVSYEWGVNGDVLSLVIKDSGSAEIGTGTSYRVYNISLSSGIALSDAKVIELAGYTNISFYEAAAQALEIAWLITNSSAVEQLGRENEMISNQIERSVSKENIDDAKPFFGSDGLLHLIACSYPMAGAEMCWVDVCVGIQENEQGVATDWNSFLTNGEYRDFLPPDWHDASAEYAVYDVNNDGVDELLMQCCELPPFYKTLVFSFEDGEVTLCCDWYGYAPFVYLESENAIQVSMESRPMFGMSLAPFYRLENGVFEPCFSVGLDEEGAYFLKDGVRTEISEDERWEYIMGTAFEWKPME